MKRAALLIVCLVACEKPEARAERLRNAATIACFDASQPSSADQRAHDMDPNYKQTPEQRQRTVDSLRGVIQAECDVATREFNQFMAGH